jgi:cytoskeleton protein RodZ
MEAAAATMEKHSYREVGELLRRARESMRLPIDNAARMLHIRVRYLDAMEQGRLEELPGLPYARGYLQTYATFLGLDKDEILRRFEDIEKSIAASSIYFPQILSKQKTPSSRLIWGGLIAAIAVYAAWGSLASHSNKKVSVVESFPVPTSGKVQISASALQDVACLKPQDEVYPPCIVAKEPDFRVMPWPEKINSVMELSENN